MSAPQPAADDLTPVQRHALHRAIEGLREDDPLRSASVAVVGWQRALLWSALLITILCAVRWPMGTAVVLVGVSTVAYLLTMTDRVLIFRQGLRSRPIGISDEAARAIPDEDLPRYTILVPAYNEPEVVGDLIGAMATLEYPRDKLQVLLLLEADDRAPGTVVDRDFVAAHSAGFADYERRTRAVDLTEVAEATGIDRAQLERVAAKMAGARRIVVCWAMGLTQHKHAVPTISEISNVLLMRGMIGKPGAGLCPVRGHSNVQGDRTMGIWEKMPETFLTALDDRFGISSPREHGLDTVDAIRAMRDGRHEACLRPHPLGKVFHFLRRIESEGP